VNRNSKSALNTQLFMTLQPGNPGIDDDSHVSSLAVSSPVRVGLVTPLPLWKRGGVGHPGHVGALYSLHCNIANHFCRMGGQQRRQQLYLNI
jgi:hypothetical protein